MIYKFNFQPWVGSARQRNKINFRKDKKKNNNNNKKEEEEEEEEEEKIGKKKVIPLRDRHLWQPRGISEWHAKIKKKKKKRKKEKPVAQQRKY